MVVWGELISKGDRDQGVFQLSNSSALIGSSDRADVRVFHEMSSVEHCLILREDSGAALVIDMSAEGTYLQQTGGVAEKLATLAECRLRDGDCIILAMAPNGKPEMWFEFRLMKENVSTKDSKEPVAKEAKKAEISENTSSKDRARQLLASALPPGFFTPTEEDATASTSNAASADGGDKSMQSLIEDNLICPICNAIFHNPVNVSPCNHVFCGGCFALWYLKSKQCPQCRQNVTTFGDHHTIKRMAEGFLEAHPNRKRSPEELDQLDKGFESIKQKKKTPSSNKWPGIGAFGGIPYVPAPTMPDFPEVDITQAAASFTGIKKRFDLDSVPFPKLGLGPKLGPNQSTHSVPKKCRQCPGAIPLVPSVVNGPPGAFPPYGSIPPPAVVAPYVCLAGGTQHLQCDCCKEPFPNRTNEPKLPQTECLMCNRFFCHLYWGCRIGCHGCLGALNAYTPTLDDIISGLESQTNYVERDYFRIYIDQKKIQAMDILRSGYELIQLSMIPELSILNVNSAVCRTCFTEMVLPAISYAYRVQLTSSDLKGVIPDRPNCPYGKQCSQIRIAEHAEAFNHV